MSAVSPIVSRQASPVHSPAGTAEVPGRTVSPKPLGVVGVPDTLASASGSGSSARSSSSTLSTGSDNKVVNQTVDNKTTPPANVTSVSMKDRLKSIGSSCFNALMFIPRGINSGVRSGITYVTNALPKAKPAVAADADASAGTATVSMKDRLKSIGSNCFNALMFIPRGIYSGVKNIFTSIVNVLSRAKTDAAEEKKELAEEKKELAEEKKELAEEKKELAEEKKELTPEEKKALEAQIAKSAASLEEAKKAAEADSEMAETIEFQNMILNQFDEEHFNKYLELPEDKQTELLSSADKAYNRVLAQKTWLGQPNTDKESNAAIEAADVVFKRI